MATSRARIEANRRNALRSTGPKTWEGKERSKGNAMKHGLTARVLRTEEEVALLGEPTPAPPGPLGASPFDASWIEGEIRLIAMRLERAARMEARLLERSAHRVSEAGPPAGLEANVSRLARYEGMLRARLREAIDLLEELRSADPAPPTRERRAWRGWLAAERELARCPG